MTPNVNLEGNVTVAVAASKATDAAGNPNTAATDNVQAVDLKAPTVTITDDKPDTVTTADANGGAITYTFTFSESVTGFAADDVVVTNGTKGTFTAAIGNDAGKVYTLVVTPTAGFIGNVTVALPADKANDTAGNPNTAAITNTQAVSLNALPVVTAFTATETSVTVLATDVDAGNTLTLALGRIPVSSVTGVVTTLPGSAALPSPPQRKPVLRPPASR